MISKYSKYLEISKNEIKVKKECYVEIDLNEYKDINEEILNDNLVLNIQGFFEIIFPEDLNSIRFTLPYHVNLFKHDVRMDKKVMTLSFKPGDTLCKAFFKNKNTSIELLSSLLQNRIKYISDDISELVINIYSQLSGITNIDLFNIEIILSKMFATVESGKLIPLRLTNKNYSKQYAIDFTKASHGYNNILGFSYGYTNKYLMEKVTKSNKIDNSYIENIITNKYSKIKELQDKETHNDSK